MYYFCQILRHCERFSAKGVDRLYSPNCREEKFSETQFVPLLIIGNPIYREESQLSSGDERVVAVARCEPNILKAGLAKQPLEFPSSELLALSEEDHVHRERGRCQWSVPRVLKEHLGQVDPPSGTKTLETLLGEETTAFPTPVMKDVA